MINPNDLTELRRMATNSYDEKGLIGRVLRGITELTNENARLKAELEKLKK